MRPVGQPLHSGVPAVARDAPDQWLLALRVERAKEQLLNSGASLANIAIDCGFADQSHFTRVLTKQVGNSREMAPPTCDRLDFVAVT